MASHRALRRSSRSILIRPFGIIPDCSKTHTSTQTNERLASLFDTRRIAQFSCGAARPLRSRSDPGQEFAQHREISLRLIPTHSVASADEAFIS
jgi:hypothetical protein